MQVEPGGNVRGCATDVIGVSDPIAVLLDPHRLGEPLRIQVGPDIWALFCRWRGLRMRFGTTNHGASGVC